MNRSELMEIIANGENSGVEFKLDNIRPEQLAKEVVALVNFRGGRILVGVADDGTIHGVKRKGLEAWIMDTVFARYVHPMILPFYEEVRLDEGKRVAVISFPQGISKPYVVRSKDREDIYVRVGSTSRLATREQQARLFAGGGMFHTELMPVPGSSIASLDKVRLENYLKDIIQDPEIPQSDEEWTRRLLGLGLLVEGPNARPVCTIAGLVLFGIAPRRYLKQAGLRLLAFAGEDKEYRSLLDEIIDAPLVGRWAPGPEGKKYLVDEGLIEKFASLIGPFISRESGTLDRHMRRTREWDYPVEAIRETVINALAHRDWTRFVDIEVGVYSRRIEVISPGALQNSMTVEKMIAGQRSPRNPLVVEVLRDYGYVDARGMGIRTKVIPLMKQHNQTEPVFAATDDFLKADLYRLKGHFDPGDDRLKVYNGSKRAQSDRIKKDDDLLIDPLNQMQVQLLNALKKEPKADYPALAKILDVSPATVKRHIQKLKNMGRLNRIGSKKTGYWEVIG